MKNYNEIAESVFERRDHYVAEKKARAKIVKRTVSAVGCCCLVALLGIGVMQSGIFEQAPSTITIDSGKNSEINPGGTIVADNIVINDIEKPEDGNRLVFLEYRDYDLTTFSVSQQIEFPSDLTNVENKAAYTKSSTGEKGGEGSDTILSWYSLIASRPESNRRITIDFSEKHYPTSSLGYGDGEVSTINGKAVTLYHYSDDHYAAKFVSDDYYYFVYAADLTQEEFLETVSTIL